jgi:hypothetical protein
MLDIKLLHSICFDGFYIVEDDGDELQPHTEFTYNLYLKGLDLGEPYGDEEVYEGIVFEDGKAFAQIERTEKLEYLEVTLD